MTDAVGVGEEEFVAASRQEPRWRARRYKVTRDDEVEVHPINGTNMVLDSKLRRLTWGLRQAWLHISTKFGRGRIRVVYLQCAFQVSSCKMELPAK